MNMINMAECIKPNKTQLNTKFIIKAKPSSSHKHSEAETDTPLPLPTDQEIHQFINYMITKSKKYKELLESNKITDDMLFSDKHLYSNKYIVLLFLS